MAVEPFAVGFDLGKEYSQICCWNADTKEPVSISVVAGAEKYRIPTESLELFLKKAMRLLKPFGKVHEAEAVVFSVEETTEERVEEFRRTAMQLMGVPESRIFVQTREESFCAYVLSQPREIWRHQTVLFICEGELLEAVVLHVGTRTVPFLARTERQESWRRPISGLEPEDKDEILCEMAREIFSERAVSSVFLVGEGFEDQWYEQALRVLCGSGRRVFAGNNLFAKGACCRAVQEAGLNGGRTYVFLDGDKISYNVGLRTPGTGKNAIYTLLEAGESWYEAKAECEALLCGDSAVEFILKPMQGGDTLKETLALPGLPDRPSRATRLRISAEFLSVDRLRVQVSDLGFGELFPSSDLTWSEEVDLGGR